MPEICNCSLNFPKCNVLALDHKEQCHHLLCTVMKQKSQRPKLNNINALVSSQIVGHSECEQMSKDEHQQCIKLSNLLPTKLYTLQKPKHNQASFYSFIGLPVFDTLCYYFPKDFRRSIVYKETLAIRELVRSHLLRINAL